MKHVFLMKMVFSTKSEFESTDLRPAHQTASRAPKCVPSTKLRPEHGFASPAPKCVPVIQVKTVIMGHYFPGHLPISSHDCPPCTNPFCVGLFYLLILLCLLPAVYTRQMVPDFAPYFARIFGGFSGNYDSETDHFPVSLSCEKTHTSRAGLFYESHLLCLFPSAHKIGDALTI